MGHIRKFSAVWPCVAMARQTGILYDESRSETHRENGRTRRSPASPFFWCIVPSYDTMVVSVRPSILPSAQHSHDFALRRFRLTAGCPIAPT
ncbi:protein of unknown function [Azospirillum baldaniorum]|uniref:Uncharacterized protein n=1 Tax=Azospirillum baldaniorum TaxID=1064539 RepID=A0A9P1JT35_9PROT|nr:protein of unknown function [Azospirillum baldaniorum]